jgi:tyrosine-protein kinase Etk/Wzc
LEKKNLEAKRIIEFIDAQLVDVSESLELTENQLQEFRSRNRIMDVSVQAGQIVTRALEYENSKARLTLEREYFDYLEEYLGDEDNMDNPILPSSMGITDPLLSTTIQELAGLQTEYYSSGVGDRNPIHAQLELRIRNTKRSIKETLSGIKLANRMSLEGIERQIESLNKEAASLPLQEQQLLGFQRKFNLNNVLYTYLLTERAEAQIQKASNKSDHELVDLARFTDLVSPRLPNVILFAFAFAIGIPTLIMLFAEMFRTTINSEEDLIFVSELPVVAQLPNSRLNYNTVVLSEPNSRIAEAFRGLRTRMDFFTRDIQSPVVLLTSSMSGEGKTFSAINLASAYSLAGKKTLLVGFDLRRPNLANIFNLRDADGLTNYLIGKSAIKDVIYKADYENLYILPSGAIPPNPGELASSEKAQVIFNELKGEYDFIVVDSPPIGIVSDIYPIAELADVVMMVVRHGRTKKNVLSSTLMEIESYGLKGISLIVNGINPRGDRYRYSYKYKYEYKNKTKNPEEQKT